MKPVPDGAIGPLAGQPARHLSGADTRIATRSIGSRAGCPLLSAAMAIAVSAGAVLAAQNLTIVQKNRAFSQSTVTIQPGEELRFTNEDGFPHQIYVKSPAFAFDSETQPPGATVAFSIPEPGRYRVLCGIHPKMRLDIEVR